MTGEQTVDAFGATDEVDSREATRIIDRMQRALVRQGFTAIVIAAIGIAAGLGQATLWEPDEPRFAEATRQMFERGDFVTPYFNGVPRFEKPILFYWLQAIAYGALGPTELAARLPSALAGIGVVLILYLFAARVTSRRAAFIAAISLATTFRFVTYARQGLTDVPVLFFIIAALYGFLRASERPTSRIAALLAWSSVGLGVLTKGPIGLLSVVIWASYAAVCRDWSLVKSTRPVGGALLAAVIALPWYAVMIFQHGRAFVDFALGHEVVARAVSEEAFAPSRSGFYYFKVWLGDAAPWSLVCIAAAAWSAVRWRRLDAARRRPIVLAVTWFLCVFILFSLSRSKLPHYVLPAYPAAALLIGVFIDVVAGSVMDAAWWRVPLATIAAVSIAASAVTAVFLSALLPDAGLAVKWLLPVVLGVGAVTIAYATWKAALLPATYALTGMLAAAFGIIGGLVIPSGIEPFKPMARLAREADRLARHDAPIGLLGVYGRSSLIFYSRRNVRTLNDDQDVASFLSTDRNAVSVMLLSDFERIAMQIPSLQSVASAQEFNVRIERVLERGRSPARVWVLVARRDPLRATGP